MSTDPRWLALLASLTLALLAAPPALASPPANDNFSAPTTVTGGSSTPATNAQATFETGEPEPHGHGMHSVWFAYTPPSGGLTTLDICDAAFDSTLGVYTGASVGALTEIVTNDDSPACPSGTNASSLSFTATAATTYHIQVDSYYDTTGTFTLLVNRVHNDNLANPIDISAGGTFAGITNFATAQTSENKHGGATAAYTAAHSIWFSYTPTASGPVEFATCGSDFDTTMGIYSAGLSFPLSSLAENDDSSACGPSSHQSDFTVNLTSGSSYDLAVDGYSGAVGNVVLRLSPRNDLFANASVLNASGPGTLSGQTDFATKESGEPNHAGDAGGRSVWYRVTPSASGPLTIDTCSRAYAGLETLLAVYTGATVGALTPVASSRDTTACGDGKQSLVTFNAVAGAAYRVAVDAVGGAAGPFGLNLRPPANDSFATPTVLTGAAPTDTTQMTIGASREIGEPTHAGAPGERSVWLDWTAVASGPVTVTTCGTDFDTLLAAYTGGAVNALTPVASNDDSTVCGASAHQSAITFNAVMGAVYHLAVDGKYNEYGTLQLHLAGTPAPPMTPMKPPTTTTTPTFAAPVIPTPLAAIFGGLTPPRTLHPRDLAAGRLTFIVRCARACTIDAALTAAQKLAKQLHLASAPLLTTIATGSARGGPGLVRVTLHATKRARNRLRKLASLPVTLRLRVRDTATGKTVSATQKLTLKR
jgi:hypothetical protein